MGCSPPRTDGIWSTIKRTASVPAILGIGWLVYEQVKASAATLRQLAA